MLLLMTANRTFLARCVMYSLLGSLIITFLLPFGLSVEYFPVVVSAFFCCRTGLYVHTAKVVADFCRLAGCHNNNNNNHNNNK